MPAVSSSTDSKTGPAKGAKGEESQVKGGKMDGYPDFGHGMLKDFQFEDGCKSVYLTQTGWLMSRFEFQPRYLYTTMRRAHNDRQDHTVLSPAQLQLQDNNSFPRLKPTLIVS
jgi:hypothetical protein